VCSSDLNTGSALLTLGSGTPILRLDGGGGQLEFAFPSGACTSGVTCNRTFSPIAAGGSLAVPLRCRPSAVGTITAQLVVNSDGFTPGGGAATSVAVSCTAIPVPIPPDVTVTPTSVAFAPQPINTISPSQPVTVRNDGGGTLTFSASVNSAHFAVGCSAGCTCSGGTCSGALLAGQTATLAASFTPQAVGGDMLASLTIATNDPDEPAPSVLLSGHATVAQLTIHPNPMHAGAVRVGSSGFADGSLRSTGEAPLHITQLSLGGAAGFTLAGPCDGQTSCSFAATVPAGTAIPIRVRCTPSAHGPIATTLTVVSDATGSPSSRTVACQGLAPSFVVSLIPGLAFGDVVVGTTATAQIILNNATANEGSQLSWSVNRTAAPYELTCASATNCSCGTKGCSGNGPASLRLAFTPLAPGPHMAQLLFATNDPQRLTASYTASGTGLPIDIDEPVPEEPPADPPGR
jgi:hypothetical protein